jgi:hypothetical protein
MPAWVTELDRDLEPQGDLPQKIRQANVSVHHIWWRLHEQQTALNFQIPQSATHVC